MLSRLPSVTLSSLRQHRTGVTRGFAAFTTLDAEKTAARVQRCLAAKDPHDRAAHARAGPVWL